MSHAAAIDRNHKVLLRCTTINCYVIDCLKAENVIDRMQEAELRGMRNSLKQRILLFMWLKTVSYQKFTSFLKVMDETEQEHVTNILTGYTGEDRLPLSDVRYDRLERIRPKIAHVLRIDSEVIAELRSLKAINWTDDDEIKKEKFDYAKSSKLVSAIMRRCNQSYDSFKNVLKKTLQAAAAEYLSEGEMPAVHLNNNQPDMDEWLSLAFNDAIKNNKPSDANGDLLAEMNGFGLNPVISFPGQSIVIFMYCKTVYNAVTFMKLFESGRLQYLLQHIFNRLLKIIQPHIVKELESRISLEDEDIATLEEFTGIEGMLSKPLWKPLGKITKREADTQTDNTGQDFFTRIITGNMPMRTSFTAFKSKDARRRIVQPTTIRELHVPGNRPTVEKFPESSMERFKLKRELEEEIRKNDNRIKRLEEHERRLGERDPVLVEAINRIKAVANTEICGLTIFDLFLNSMVFIMLMFETA